MSEFKRTIDENNEPALGYLRILKILRAELIKGNCLIFLGAGASVDKQRKCLPSAQVLSKEMSKECDFEWHEFIPLSTIAFHYESQNGRELLNHFIEEQIDNPDIHPSTTIEIITRIIGILEEMGNSNLIVTTNYDQHFERAYYKAFDKQPDIVIYRGGIDPNDKKSEPLHYGLGEHEQKPEYWKPNGKTCVYKMHGCISKAEGQNLVITEEDYINFLSNSMGDDRNKRLLHYVTGVMSLSKILFVGYSLTDWNYRVLHKAIKEKIKHNDSYAVQYFDSSKKDEKEVQRWNNMVEFWKEKNVSIVNSDAAAFMKDLLWILLED